jgi:hypothetical protein
MNVVCQTGPCKSTLSSQCVYYMGENLIYTGINTNDSIETVLIKLNTFLSNTLPSIGSEQISFEKDVFQVAHELVIGDAIRHNGSIWIKAQADVLNNSGTVAVVSGVFSTNNFTYQFGGLLTIGSWVDGTSYFLSTGTAGGIVPEEQYNNGQVREFIGTGTPDGLLIELDLGDLQRVSNEVFGNVGSNTVKYYRSFFETDLYIYAGYNLNGVEVIERELNGIIQIAQDTTGDLEADWLNRLILTYV